MDAVIFDFDGTLADSEPIHEVAIRGLLEPIGLSFDHAFFVANCIGASDTVAYRRIAALHGRELSDTEIAELRPRKHRAFTDLVRSGRVAAFPGAVELVRAARNRGPVAVCTGSLGEQVEPVLEQFGVLPLLDTMVSADQVARAKPDPEGYLLTAKRLGVDPARCIAIEDSPTGIRAAVAAGMRVVAVTHSYPADMLTEADRVFEVIAEITLGELESVVAVGRA